MHPSMSPTLFSNKYRFELVVNEMNTIKKMVGTPSIDFKPLFIHPVGCNSKMVNALYTKDEKEKFVN